MISRRMRWWCVWHGWGRRESYTDFFVWRMTGRDHIQDLSVDEEENWNNFGLWLQSITGWYFISTYVCWRYVIRELVGAMNLKFNNSWALYLTSHFIFCEISCSVFLKLQIFAWSVELQLLTVLPEMMPTRVGTSIKFAMQIKTRVLKATVTNLLKMCATLNSTGSFQTRNEFSWCEL